MISYLINRTMITSLSFILSSSLVLKDDKYYPNSYRSLRHSPPNRLGVPQRDKMPRKQTRRKESFKSASKGTDRNAGTSR